MDHFTFYIEKYEKTYLIWDFHQMKENFTITFCENARAMNVKIGDMYHSNALMENEVSQEQLLQFQYSELDQMQIISLHNVLMKVQPY